MLPNKTEIHNRCKKIIDEKINDLKVQISDLNLSFQNESKSSAGDKHETARAMAQLESEKLHQQLFRFEQQSASLNKYDVQKKHEIVRNGSVILTNRGIFYISIALGIIDKESNLAAISMASPLGKLFMNKKAGESFSFNGVDYVIEEIY